MQEYNRWVRGYIKYMLLYTQEAAVCPHSSLPWHRGGNVQGPYAKTEAQAETVWELGWDARARLIWNTAVCASGCITSEVGLGKGTTEHALLACHARKLEVCPWHICGLDSGTFSWLLCLREATKGKFKAVSWPCSSAVHWQAWLGGACSVLPSIRPIIDPLQTSPWRDPRGWEVKAILGASSLLLLRR